MLLGLVIEADQMRYYTEPLEVLLPWLGQAVLYWVLAVLALALILGLAAWILFYIRELNFYRERVLRARDDESTGRAGPLELHGGFKGYALFSAGRVSKDLARLVWQTLADVFRLPMGLWRVGAVASLTVQETIRRRVLYVFFIFFVPFLFAGWYLPTKDEGRLALMVVFVSTCITWLLLPLVVFIVSMGFPQDYQRKTLFTILTKPVRRAEWFVGRYLGYVSMFTLMLLAMGGVGYLFLQQQLASSSNQRIATAKIPLFGTAPDDIDTLDGEPAQSPLLFRRSGTPGFSQQGVNVGDVWKYRSHIEGGTGDTAHWFFEFDRSLLEGRATVRLEMTFEIFKIGRETDFRKDDETSGTRAQIEIRNRNNPDGPTYWSQVRVRDGRVTVIDDIPVSLFQNSNDKTPKKTATLNGPAGPSHLAQMEVTVQALQTNQFIGMAAADMYFLLSGRSFLYNFSKSLFSIWLKMILLIGLALTAGTVLNGFVAILVTVGIFTLGFQYDFVQSIASSGKQVGPGEALFRILIGKIWTKQLDQSTLLSVVQGFDEVLLGLFSAVAQVVPDLQNLNTVAFVADGFNVPETMLFRDTVAVVGYLIPLLFLGFLLFESREVAR